MYPQSGLPEPAIGFLQDSLRFWDRTLKGIENGMLTEPPVHAWKGFPSTPWAWTPTRSLAVWPTG